MYVFVCMFVFCQIVQVKVAEFEDATKTTALMMVLAMALAVDVVGALVTMACYNFDRGSSWCSGGGRHRFSLFVYSLLM